jgi:stearoyl-CoA desaturase (delta-9 desaturase)
VLVLSLAGFQALVWGCFVSTILLYHGTFSINSLMHVIGKRVYDTGDDSKNSFVLALVTMGEGWHNNHHYYRASANQGFRWYEIDLTFYILVVLEKLGVIWDVKRAPRDVIEGRRSVRKRPVRGLRRDSVAGPGGQSHAPVAVGLDPGGVSAQAAGRPKETVSV